jgi:hypothetical protein
MWRKRSFFLPSQCMTKGLSKGHLFSPFTKYYTDLVKRFSYYLPLQSILLTSSQGCFLLSTFTKYNTDLVIGFSPGAYCLWNNALQSLSADLNSGKRWRCGERNIVFHSGILSAIKYFTVKIINQSSSTLAFCQHENISLLAISIINHLPLWNPVSIKIFHC